MQFSQVFKHPIPKPIILLKENVTFNQRLRTYHNTHLFPLFTIFFKEKMQAPDKKKNAVSQIYKTHIPKTVKIKFNLRRRRPTKIMNFSINYSKPHLPKPIKINLLKENRPHYQEMIRAVSISNP